ncbi:MAG: PPOX class F420-dependent oxidoreductase [Anaerolineae bacterium]|nr:PPOX class F420-dependent oxidoreductase [Thermoflexales bacterium]MDW8406150.1 PPOX class F420-dependent oxidoreductase [Anaerolineae bacterium]
MFDSEVIEFLNRPLLMRLATLGADGYPQVTPVWYLQEGGRLFTSTQRDRVKYRNMARDRRVGASIDDDAQPYRGVSIKGLAILHEPGEPGFDMREMVRRIVARYTAPAEVDGMVEWLFQGPRVVIEIEPVHVVKIGSGWTHG